nr:MAG TPA: hypothetical protein [Caudoviricetes sp.]
MNQQISKYNDTHYHRMKMSLKYHPLFFPKSYQTKDLNLLRHLSNIQQIPM